MPFVEYTWWTPQCVRVAGFIETYEPVNTADGADDTSRTGWPG